MKASTTEGREGAGALRIAPTCPVPLGRGELAFHPGGDGTTDPTWCSSVQYLSLVWGVLGGLQVETLTHT